MIAKSRRIQSISTTYAGDNVTQILLSQNSSEFEYRQQRYVLSNEHLSLNSAVEIFERYELYKELHNEISENNVELEKSLIERADVEYQQQLLFNHFWLTNNYSEEENAQCR